MEKAENSDKPPEGRLMPLTFYLPKTSANKEIYQNGLSKIIDRLVVKTETDIEKCWQLWEKFSPKKSIFQLWDFRYSWYQGWGFQPYFYTIYLGKKPVAVLPLWFNEIDKKYEWFGGYWPEDNCFFVSDTDFILPLLKIAPKPILLNAIEESDSLLPFKDIYFTTDTPKYIINASSYKTVEEYFMTLKKKNRHHLRYYKSQFSQIVTKIEFVEGDESKNLRTFFKLSIFDYERKEEDSFSEYRKKQRLKTFEMIYKNQGIYKIVSLYIWVGDYLAAYDILGIYKNNLYLLTGAADLQRFPGLGVYITAIELEKAWEWGVSLIDCMQEDYNWKHKYFTPKNLLRFEKS